ncbi:unnamed protein product [Mycena citricolor]|uniref:Uncharacterized protein n=1 Tax=Mycena citricolor TaxID=2018698 RepID=A0AAD2H325_9AGAR|nr:unnamed protein product [Mycena citricolor]
MISAQCCVERVKTRSPFLVVSSDDDEMSIFGYGARCLKTDPVQRCSSDKHCGIAGVNGCANKLVRRDTPFLPFIWSVKAVATSSAVVSALKVGLKLRLGAFISQFGLMTNSR